MAQVSHVLARLRRDPLSDLPLGPPLEQQLRQQGCLWRDRIFSPLVTVRLFLTQVLCGNIAVAALRQLCGLAFADSSYSEARSRLQLDLLQWMLQWLTDRAAGVVDATRKIGSRILIVDGSTYSMSDTPELLRHFDLPRGTRAGVGYPVGKIMGLLDAATGMFIRLLALPLFQHDMRGVINLHPLLQSGDILLGDRAFCSFCHVALLNARGVLAAVRLHQRRKNKSSGIDRWHKPKKMPAWMDAATFAQMPAFLDVRIVCYTISQKGYRTRKVLVATTLMDQATWPDERVAELFGHRWQIETCFNHLKTTMKMNVLRCKTVDGVQKELAVYLAAYNLVRLAMLQAAARQAVSVRRISFIDAMRYLAARALGLPGVSRLIINPDRAGRCQLRVIRRRLKQYDLLVRPRREMEAELAGKAGGSA